MGEHHKPTSAPSSTQDGGVRVTTHSTGARRALVYKGLAAALVVACAAYLWHKRGTALTAAETQRVAQADAHDDAATDIPQDSPQEIAMPRRVVTGATGDGTEDPTPDLADYLPAGEAPTMEEVIEGLHEAGIHSGLGAFQPPGTSPPLLGLAVPEDYALPEGYVRHYQATDDGQRIEPILMFSPDFEFFDADGRPINIPDNRVVPPEMAPPGLPIRTIEIPKPLQPGKP